MKTLGHLVTILLVMLVCCFARCVAGEFRVEAPTAVPRDKMVRCKPVDAPEGSAVVWDVSPDDNVDTEELPDGRLFFSAPPGTYRVRARALKNTPQGTVAYTARAVVVVGQQQAPPGSPTPPKPDKPQSMVPQCIGRLRVGNAGCTATPIHPRRPDGRWDVLTASHCTGGTGSKGTLMLKDGRELSMTVASRQEGPDITWFVTDRADLGDLPYGVLASTDPPPGTAVWQAGYGTDRPTLRKDGVAIGADPNGQLAFRLSVSHGDSGGPIFRADTNEVVACVCCTRGIAIKTEMWGGSATSAARIRPGSTMLPITDDGVSLHAGCVHPIDRGGSPPVLLPLLPHGPGARPY